MGVAADLAPKRILFVDQETPRMGLALCLASDILNYRHIGEGPGGIDLGYLASKGLSRATVDKMRIKGRELVGMVDQQLALAALAS